MEPEDMLKALEDQAIANRRTISTSDYKKTRRAWVRAEMVFRHPEMTEEQIDYALDRAHWREWREDKNATRY